MFELAYCSTANSDLKQSDIEDILDIARSFNSENDITGCVLYYNDEFVQVLEGEEKVVRELYERIKQDSRHSIVILLSTSTKSERTFSNWSMAYPDFDAADIKKANFIDNFLAFSDLVDQPTKTILLFWTMVRNMLTED